MPPEDADPVEVEVGLSSTKKPLLVTLKRDGERSLGELAHDEETNSHLLQQALESAP